MIDVITLKTWAKRIDANTQCDIFCCRHFRLDFISFFLYYYRAANNKSVSVSKKRYSPSFPFPFPVLVNCRLPCRTRETRRD